MLLNIYMTCFAIGVIYTLVTTFINGLVSAVDLHAHFDGHMDGHMDTHLDGHMDTHMDGHLDGHMDAHADGHFDSHMDAHTDGHFDGHTGPHSLGHIDMHGGGPHIDLALPLRPFTIMILITVFGGMGMILTIIFGRPAFMLSGLMLDIVTLPLSILVAYAIAKLLYQTVYVSLVRAQTTTTRSESDAIGLQAEVVVAISPKLMGKISYIVNETILSSPAKPYYSDENGYRQGSKVVIKDIKDHVCLVAGLPEDGRGVFSESQN